MKNALGGLLLVLVAASGCTVHGEARVRPATVAVVAPPPPHAEVVVTAPPPPTATVEVNAAPAAVVEVEAAPPPVQVEAEATIVRPGHIWIGGRWNWVGGRWVWMRGHYEAERVGHIWVPGRWEMRGNRHVWVEGRWEAHATVRPAAGPVVRDHR